MVFNIWIIPRIVFFVIIGAAVVSLLDIDLVEQGKKAISSFTDGRDQAETENAELAGAITEMEGTIASLQTKVAELETELTDKNNQLDSLERENEELLIAQEEGEAGQGVQHDLTEVAKLYESMSAKNAARIIAELSVDEALMHLSYVSLESRAAILAKLESSDAADIVVQWANQN